jgi:hypothetical protein
MRLRKMQASRKAGKQGKHEYPSDIHARLHTSRVEGSIPEHAI